MLEEKRRELYVHHAKRTYQNTRIVMSKYDILHLLTKTTIIQNKSMHGMKGNQHKL